MGDRTGLSRECSGVMQLALALGNAEIVLVLKIVSMQSMKELTEKSFFTIGGGNWSFLKTLCRFSVS